MKCRRCDTKLVEDPKRGCSVCLKCYPNALKAQPIPLPKKQENKRVGMAMTDEMVREIVRDELSKTGRKMETRTASEVVEDDDFGEMTATEVAEARKGNTEIKELTATEVIAEMDITDNYRAHAKALGIPLNQPTGGARKKIDVLADIAEKTKSPDEG